MAGIGDRQLVRFGVEHQQDERDEAVSHSLRMNVFIEGGEDFSRCRLRKKMQSHGRIEPGHEQSGGNPLAGDVGQTDRNPPVRHHDIVEIIASHAMGRLIIVEEFVAGRIGTLLRQKAKLDLRGEAKLPLDVGALQQVLVEPGILNRQAGLCSHAHQARRGRFA